MACLPDCLCVKCVTPRPGMKYVRPDGSVARVNDVRDGVAWGMDDLGYDRLDLSDYTLDLNDGPTLGALEHDVLQPAGWWVERLRGVEWRASCRTWACPWRNRVSDALRDALEVIVETARPTSRP